MYCHEIRAKIEDAKINLDQVDTLIREYAAVVDVGTLVNWVAARNAWKDTIHELEMDLKDAEFRMFSHFLKSS